MARKLRQNTLRLACGIATYSSLWSSCLFEGLEESTTILCARAAPGFLADALIGLSASENILIVDPDYTFLAMTRFSEGLKQFWSQIFGQGREIREIMITPMTKFLREDIKEFKVCSLVTKLRGQGQKREFNRLQDRYEELVGRFASQSKAKEPSALREVEFRRCVLIHRMLINYTLFV